MTPSEKRRKFLAAVRAQVRRRHRQVDEGTLRVLGTLTELRETLTELLAGQPTDFQARQIPRLLGEIDRQVERWHARAIGEADRWIEAALELGPQMIEAPLAAAEIHVGRIILPDSLLDELKDYTASKIKNVGPIVRQQIERQITVTVLGGQTPHEAMKAVSQHLGERPMRFVSFRTETIVRTEMGRVHSEAADRRQRNAAKVLPDLKKQWTWSFKSRAQHKAIHEQVREIGAPFDLPDGTQMQYPREMDAPVEHVANCGCESVPYMDTWT